MLIPHPKPGLAFTGFAHGVEGFRVLRVRFGLSSRRLVCGFLCISSPEPKAGPTLIVGLRSHGFTGRGHPKVERLEHMPGFALLFAFHKKKGFGVYSFGFRVAYLTKLLSSQGWLVLLCMAQHGPRDHFGIFETLLAQQGRDEESMLRVASALDEVHVSVHRVSVGCDVDSKGLDKVDEPEDTRICRLEIASRSCREALAAARGLLQPASSLPETLNPTNLQPSL